MRGIKSKFWEFSQYVFGADDGKIALYRRASGIEEMLPGNRRVLDFGCATGNVAMAFLDCHYLGVDIDQSSVEFARQKYSSNSNLSFLTTAEFQSICEDGHWPLVVLAATAHHLDDSALEDVLRFLARLLEPGGRICFIEPVTMGNESQLLRFLMAMDQGHFHRTTGTYQVLFERWGFQVNHIEHFRLRGRFFPQPYGVIMSLEKGKPLSNEGEMSRPG